MAGPLRGADPPFPGGARGGGRAKTGRDGQHDRPAADPPGLPPRSVGLVRAGRAAPRHGRADHLQPRHQRISARPAGRPFGLGRDAGGVGSGRAGVGVGAEARPARRGRPRPPRVPPPADHPRHAAVRTTPGPDLQPPGRPRIQPPAGNQPPHELFDRSDPENARRVAEAQPQARRQVQRGCRPAGHARRFHRAGRGGQVPGAAGRGADAEPRSSAPTIASFSPAARPTRRRGNTSSGRSIRPNG